MSISLRTPSPFFAFAPIFFKGREPGLKRREPVIAKPVAKPADPARPATPAKPAARTGVDFDKLLASTRKAPVDLAPIEWEGDKGTSIAPAPAALADAAGCEFTDGRTRRIRDRYISARFPGVARSAADLECVERVIKCARLYFEDGQLAAALELLDMAIEQDSRAESLWLAELEILFLSRDAARFVECARAFRALHGASAQWAEVARLGQTIAPRESLFGTKGAPRGHEHYGPWPDLPNWIQANWDLTSECLGADFHRLLEGRAAQARDARDKPQLGA
ncbi:MAG TPA: hypothetical protein VH040_05725 [Usitatibacter sp.]|jgi:hypothetical protein|nr:hypothetical protein [Usitatibacter sp.]